MSANPTGATSFSEARKRLGLFTERGLTVYASAAAIAYISAMARLLLAHTPFFRDANCKDFTWIWLSSRFAASSTPVHVYDYSAFVAAKNALIGPPACILEHFDYPPTLLFFVYPLSLFPYAVAFAVWIGATLLVYLAAVYIILPHRNSVILAVTIFPAWINILIGHDGFLTAGIMGLALAFAEARPRLAGLFLALLTYKPQFGILFPVALAIARKWRMLAAASIGSVVFAALAAVAFGHEVWPAFIQALADRASALNGDQESARPLVSALFLTSLGVSSQIAWTVQLMISAVTAGTVWVIWARCDSYSLKAAALAIGSLLASPHVLRYDACILTIGAAFFVKDGLLRGFLSGERGMLTLCWAGLFLLSRFVPEMIALALLALVVRRVIVFQSREAASQRVGGLERSRA